MKVMCNLCGWETEDDNIYGKQRHEEWHEIAMIKRASKNVILGKVVWKPCQ